MPKITLTGHRVQEWVCPCCTYEAVEANRLDPVRKAKSSSSSSALRDLQQEIAGPKTLGKRKKAVIPFTGNEDNGSHRTGLDFFNDPNSDDSGTDEGCNIRA